MSSLNVVIFGRENVGKSSIFNMLTTSKESLISPVSGSTRDFKKATISLGVKSCYIYDMAGYIEDSYKKEYIDKLLKESFLILFVVESYGLSSLDYVIYNKILKLHKKILLVINKIDLNPENNFMPLGLDSIAISSYKAFKIPLLEKIFSYFPSSSITAKKTESNPCNCIILGRPNVGKSSLVNAILGYNRCFVSQIAGTTTDLISESFFYKGVHYKIVDTAGINKSMYDDQLFKKCWIKTDHAIKKADIIILVIDISSTIVKQDKIIIGIANKYHKNAIIVLNKSDLSSETKIKDLEICDYKFKKLIMSAKYNKNIVKLLDTIDNIFRSINKNISSQQLISWLVSQEKLKKFYCLKNPRFVKDTGLLFLDCKKRPSKGHHNFLKSCFIKQFELKDIFIDIIYKY